MNGRLTFWLVVVLILTAFAVRNIPWHLDDFDQAKQAYVSWEMVRQGHWWVQHTPDGDSATKPPFAGWLSVLFYGLTGGTWSLAWRLPSFLSALGVMLVLDRGVRRLLGEGDRDGWMLRALVLAAFGFNLLAPRLATLVRTDMLLTLQILVLGYLIWKNAATGEPWTFRARLVFALWLLASMLTKGPLAVVFLGPGLLACWVVRKRQGERFNGWPGWWPWIVSLIVFLLWVVVGCVVDRGFYEEVVLKEFVGRVTGQHQSQPVYFYVTQLLHKLAPWSWLLAVLLFVKTVWRGWTRDPGLLWLVCWVAGGLIVMSFVPSKRTDRIFPIVPPAALLTVALITRWRQQDEDGFEAKRSRLILAGKILLAAAAVSSVGYTIYQLYVGVKNRSGGIVTFGRHAREIAERNGWKLAVIKGHDEGMLMYAGVDRFISDDDAADQWIRGELDAVVIEKDKMRKAPDVLKSAPVILEGGPTPEVDRRYFLVARARPRD